MFSPTFLSQGATSCRGKPKQYSHHAIEYLVLSFLKKKNNNKNNLALLSFLLLTGVIAQGSSPTGSRKEIITAACLVCGLSCLCLELIATLGASEALPVWFIVWSVYRLASRCLRAPSRHVFLGREGSQTFCSNVNFCSLTCATRHLCSENYCGARF